MMVVQTERQSRECFTDWKASPRIPHDFGRGTVFEVVCSEKRYVWETINAAAAAVLD